MGLATTGLKAVGKKVFGKDKKFDLDTLIEPDNLIASGATAFIAPALGYAITNNDAPDPRLEKQAQARQKRKKAEAAHNAGGPTVTPYRPDAKIRQRIADTYYD